MTGLIVLNGNLKEKDYLKELCEKADYIVCADGGYSHLLNCGITPDVIVGDFDSIKEVPVDIKKVVYPCEKDDTDAQLAIAHLQEKKADRIIVTSALGGRCDHELANLLLLIDGLKKGMQIIIDEPDVTIEGINDCLSIEAKAGDLVSIIPIEDVFGITIEGFKYPLNNDTLLVGSCRGVSNVLKQTKATIKLKKGCALVFINKRRED